MSEGPPPLPVDTEVKSNSREKLPVAEVSNEVVWVNNAFPNAPFNLREGESTSLGVFLTSSEDEARHVGVEEYHKRTGLLGQVIFEDIDGNHYRDVDAKGIGYTEFEVGDERPKLYSPERSDAGQGVLGLMDRSIALKDASMAEELLLKGVRTYRALGVTKLNEIVIPANSKNPGTNAERITIEGARERGIIPKDYEPVVEFRAFGTHRRVLDLEGTNILPIESQSYVADAKTLVAEELGVAPENFSNEAYLHWFGKSLAENVARMHKAGYTHGYLTKHNVTLDCRIVDLDSVTPVTKAMDAIPFVTYFKNPTTITPEQYEGYQSFNIDFGQAKETFTELAGDIANNTGLRWDTDSLSTLNQLFYDAYIKELESQTDRMAGPTLRADIERDTAAEGEKLDILSQTGNNNAEKEVRMNEQKRKDQERIDQLREGLDLQ